MWPGFGENSRVLKWVIERVEGTGAAVDTPIGRVPDRRRRSTPTASTSTPPRWPSWSPWTPRRGAREIPLIEDHYEAVGERLPGELRDELRELEKRLASST